MRKSRIISTPFNSTIGFLRERGLSASLCPKFIYSALVSVLLNLYSAPGFGQVEAGDIYEGAATLTGQIASTIDPNFCTIQVEIDLDITLRIDSATTGVLTFGPRVRRFNPVGVCTGFEGDQLPSVDTLVAINNGTSVTASVFYDQGDITARGPYDFSLSISGTSVSGFVSHDHVPGGGSLAGTQSGSANLTQTQFGGIEPEVPLLSPETKETLTEISNGLSAVALATGAALAAVTAGVTGVELIALLAAIGLAASAAALLIFAAPAVLGAAFVSAWSTLQAAVISIVGQTAGLAVALFNITAGVTFLALAASLAAHDPPDFDYMTDAEPSFIAAEINQDSPGYVESSIELSNTLARAADFSIVSVRSLEKLQGAVIDGANGIDTSDAQVRQLNRFVEYWLKSAQEAERASELVTEVRTQMQADGIADVPLDESARAAFESALDSFTVPVVLRDTVLQPLELSDEELVAGIASVRDDLSNNSTESLFGVLDQLSVALSLYSASAFETISSLNAVSNVRTLTLRKLRTNKFGFLPVLVFSDITDTADEAPLDVSTISLENVGAGPNGATPIEKLSRFRDINNDGDTDLILWFRVRDLGIDCSTNDIILSGQTEDGVLFHAPLPVKIVLRGGCDSRS